MLKRSFVFAVLAAIVCAGCASTQANKKTGFLNYNADLSSVGSKEVVEVEDKSASGAGIGTEVVVYSRGKEKKKLDAILLPGTFSKIDFIQLDSMSDIQQIAIYTRLGDNSTNLVVYRLQNNILSKMFDATSEYGINLDNMGVITRIKIGKAGKSLLQNSPNCVNEWESWVWTGDKFIKE